MKKTIVYKLVYELNRKKISFWALCDATVEYGTKIVSEPPGYLKEQGYGLLAFDTRESAEAFCACTMGFFKLYKAEATGVRTNNLPPPQYDMDYQYAQAGPLPPVGLRRAWPHGTVMCDTIRLLGKRIWGR